MIVTLREKKGDVSETERRELADPGRTMDMEIVYLKQPRRSKRVAGEEGRSDGIAYYMTCAEGQ